MVKIATWNVNSIGIRENHLVKWVKTAKPDIILLQELKRPTEAFPYEQIEDLGYNIFVKGQKTYNGVAILSKAPLEDKRDCLPHDPLNFFPEQARYIEAVTFGMRVASIYVPNGQEVGSEKYSYKLAFMSQLYQHIRTLLSYEEILVLGGDYNVAPHPIDIYKPTDDSRILSSPLERSHFYKLLHLGLANAVRDRNPDLPHLYSWWDYRKGAWEQNHGFLIDHLLLSPQASDKLVDAGIDCEPRGWEKASDHAPVWCILND